VRKALGRAETPAASAAGRALATVLASLGGTTSGLSSDEVVSRRARFGRNEATSKSRAANLLELARPLANPLVAILLIAGVASAFLGQTTDAVIIAAIVLVSSGLNAWQTFRSEAAVRHLQVRIAPTATALRDGVWRDLPRAELVPGDVVRLAAGDLVPADARLLEARDLHVQQAALTGEALPAEKAATRDELASVGPDSPSLVFLGTSVVSGTATAVVVAIGPGTAFGDVVTRLAARPDETEFERGMKRFGFLILRTVFFLVLLILLINVSLGRNALESLLFSVALAVGLTPEFLPIITTVTLAEGARRMAEQKVIVKHLSAIQNLGSIDILCSDKTGTLTSGTMSLDGSLGPFGESAERPLELARLNSCFETGIRSPLDVALLENAGTPSQGYEKTDEIPFDFERRRLSVVVRNGEHLSLITKGAPEGVLAACTNYELEGRVAALDEATVARSVETFRALSERGYRVLAVASRTVDRPDGHGTVDERSLTLAGFVTFADHLLEGTSASIERLRQDGVAVKILTGDNELVTAHICREAGIDASDIVLGSEIEQLDAPALARVAERASVFARVSPAAKHRIIRALKAHGHVVGFLGDGINDAPSLHGADVGISVAGAVDVARERRPGVRGQAATLGHPTRATLHVDDGPGELALRFPDVLLAAPRLPFRRSSFPQRLVRRIPRDANARAVRDQDGREAVAKQAEPSSHRDDPRGSGARSDSPLSSICGAAGVRAPSCCLPARAAAVDRQLPRYRSADQSEATAGCRPRLAALKARAHQVARDLLREDQRIERLRDVAVTTCGTHPLLVPGHRVGRQGNDDDTRSLGLLLQAASQLEPVHARHLDIHQDQARGERFQEPQGVVCITCRAHVVARVL